MSRDCTIGTFHLYVVPVLVVAALIIVTLGLVGVGKHPDGSGSAGTQGPRGDRGATGEKGDVGNKGDMAVCIFDDGGVGLLNLDKIIYPHDDTLEFCRYTDSTLTSSELVLSFDNSGRAFCDQSDTTVFTSELVVNKNALCQDVFVKETPLCLESNILLGSDVRTHMFFLNSNLGTDNGWWLGTQDDVVSAGGDLDLYFATQTHGVRDRVAWIADSGQTQAGGARTFTSTSNLNRALTGETNPPGVIGNHSHDRFILDAIQTFTGQHRCITEDFNMNIVNSIGLIVISTGRIVNNNSSLWATINEALPVVKITDEAHDQRVFGVISKQEKEDSRHPHRFGNFVSNIRNCNKNECRLHVNSVGEGGVWVCNINGPLENGDYVTTSPVKGLWNETDG